MCRLGALTIPVRRDIEDDMVGTTGKSRMSRAALAALRMGLVPAVLYFLCFCVITYPLILFLSTHLVGQPGDALLHAWDLWWVSKAVTELHQSPWHTTYLHFPHGTTLLGHALNPLNGFMAIPLLRIMSLNQTYNFLLVFSFVASGLAAFLLAYRFTRSYWGSFAAGFIFTFSSYHFAHAWGHPELCSMHWIPLFLLSWYALINKPRISLAVASAFLLFLNLLTTPYYFLNCIIAALVFVIWHLVAWKSPLRLFTRRYTSALLGFLGTTFLTAGPLAAAVVLSNIKDPFLGCHNPRIWSVDLLARFICGGCWRFAALTKFYWSKLPGNIAESCVHIGLSVTFLAAWAWIKRRELPYRETGLWLSITFVFGVLALGPVLHVWGKEIPFILLPYALVERIFPPLRLAGCPNRTMPMVFLGVGILSAYGFLLLSSKLRGKRLFLLVPLVSLLVIEYLPRQIPASAVDIPWDVQILRALPEKGGIIDTTCLGDNWMDCRVTYYQTVHGKPRAFGYISRVPQSVALKDTQIMRLLRQGKYSALYTDHRFAYIISGTSLDDPSLKLLYVTDIGIHIYELGHSSAVPGAR